MFGTEVEVNARDVMAQNILDSLFACVALIDVEVKEYVEHIAKDVAGATAEVSTTEVSKLIKMIDMIIVTLLLINKILPFRLENVGIIRMVVEVDATDGVLYHILYDPMRCEDLCGRSYLISIVFAFLSEHLVLTLRDIELIEPTDELARLVVFIGDEFGMIQVIDKAILGKDVVWQQQLRVVGHASEALADDGVGMAVGRDKDGKLLRHLCVIVEEFHEALTVSLRHRRYASCRACIIDDLGGASLINVCKHRLNDAVLLQNADSHKAVEPSVGSLLIDVMHPMIPDSIIKCHPLVIETLCHQLTIPQRTTLHELGLHGVRHVALAVEAERGELCLHTAFILLRASTANFFSLFVSIGRTIMLFDHGYIKAFVYLIHELLLDAL